MNLFLIIGAAYALLQISYSVYKNASEGEFGYIVFAIIIQYIIPFVLFYFSGVNA